MIAQYINHQNVQDFSNWYFSGPSDCLHPQTYTQLALGVVKVATYFTAVLPVLVFTAKITSDYMQGKFTKQLSLVGPLLSTRNAVGTTHVIKMIQTPICGTLAVHILGHQILLSHNRNHNDYVLQLDASDYNISHNRAIFLTDVDHQPLPAHLQAHLSNAIAQADPNLTLSFLQTAGIKDYITSIDANDMRQVSLDTHIPTVDESNRLDRDFINQLTNTLEKHPKGVIPFNYASDRQSSYIVFSKEDDLRTFMNPFSALGSAGWDRNGVHIAIAFSSESVPQILVNQLEQVFRDKIAEETCHCFIDVDPVDFIVNTRDNELPIIDLLKTESQSEE
jgi:hypothetical protein